MGPFLCGHLGAAMDPRTRTCWATVKPPQGRCTAWGTQVGGGGPRLASVVAERSPDVPHPLAGGRLCRDPSALGEELSWKWLRQLGPPCEVPRRLPLGKRGCLRVRVCTGRLGSRRTGPHGEHTVCKAGHLPFMCNEGLIRTPYLYSKCACYGLPDYLPGVSK